MADYSNDQQEADPHLEEAMISHQYFLWRQGLISDWPRPNSSSADDAHDAHDDGGASWRTRDALTSILGTDASIVKSDSGLTAVEVSLLAADQRNQHNQLLDHHGSSSSSSANLAVPVASILAPLLPTKNNTNNANNESHHQEANKQQLNVEHVRRALDAAAFAIVRGNQRQQQAAQLAPASASTNSASNILLNSKTEQGEGAQGNKSSNYDPPLIMAMEAIRIARITSLGEASSGSTKSVPPFLKKNNTIPWFHVPVQQATSRTGGVSAASASVASSSSKPPADVPSSVMSDKSEGIISDGKKKISDIVSVKKEHEKADTKKRSNPSAVGDVSSTVGNVALKNKRIKLEQKARTLSPSSSTKETAMLGKQKKEPKVIVDTPNTNTKKSKTVVSGKKGTATSSSSSSKHSLLKSPITSHKSKKITRSPSSITEDGASSSSVGMKNNATVSRAIISAAAAGVFQELHPDCDANDNNHDVVTAATEREISKITASDNNLGTTPGEEMNKMEPNNNLGHDSSTVKTGKKASSPNSRNNVKDEEDEQVNNMDGVVAQAKRLGNRVLDQSKGAARRGDQRREFRMDAALSKIVGRGGGGLGPTFVSQGQDEARTRKSAGGRNPFLVSPAHTLPLVVPNPFLVFSSDENAGVDNHYKGGDSVDMDLVKGPVIAPFQKKSLNDAEWTESCLPRMLAILNKGAGHAILHDRQWNDRSFRIANLLQNMATSSLPPREQSSTQRALYPNYGPHLVVTSSGEDFDKFAAVFGQLGHGLHSTVFKKGDRSSRRGCNFPTASSDDDVLLRVLPYHGSKAQRRQLRKHFGSVSPSPESHFSFLGGLPDSPFHVILTTYSELVEDYAHFCQIPFQVVVLDDGMSWLGCSHSDPHGKIGKVWNSGLWNNFDFGSGRAGVAVDGGQISTSWDFSKDAVGLDAGDKPKISSSSVSGSVGERNSRGKLPIGLTARHRILLASSMHAQYRGQIYKAPVLGLLSFLAPQFAEAVRDDWERSRLFSCKKSMAYIRTMIARLIVVYAGDAIVRDPNDLIVQSLKSLNGELPLPSLNNRIAQEDEGLDKLIKSQKIVHSRKFAVAWFQPFSSIRKELGIMSFDSILTAVKRSNAMGFACEEAVTASSLTASGAGGCVVGLSAYRPAVRCGRCFSSEQGLKQHIASSHAPPGTWLCRSCGGDCGTSQARAHHERTCKVPRRLIVKKSQGGDAPTVGQVIKPSRGRKKKESKNNAMSEKKSVKDAGRSKRVIGYKGVWVLTNGKYFVKVDDKPLMDDHSEKETSLLFDTADAAGKKYDEIITERGNMQDVKLNYKSDGSRIIHSDGDGAVDVSAGKGVDNSGSGASIATPDLSVIDIKKLPPHVKPLLRDPNQTSRTGGNSKRYVYAYRGVCRQQRKGHDRWQSQISHNGQNHYLGTFDSEWDAAAVYSWAHLLLYGEEATKKAAQEGEEAAAAFAQHEKDIAEGKILPPSPKPVKKKKRGAPKKIHKADTSGVTSQKKPKREVKAEALSEVKDNATIAETHASVHSKKKRPISLKEWGKLKTECAMMLSSGTKGTSKATILATRKDIADMSEKQLLHNISSHISGHFSSISKSFLQSSQASDKKFQQLPASSSLDMLAPPMRPGSNAVLIGLQASDFGWKMKKFIDACQDASAQNAVALSLKLSNEFGAVGANRSFCTFLLSPSCTMGRASNGSQNPFLSSDHVKSTLGMPVGNLECNIGGPDYSCSEMAAMIQFLPSKFGNFQFMACNDDDIITLNGQRISASMGPRPLRNKDVCSVGARVFVFIEKVASNCWNY